MEKQFAIAGVSNEDRRKIVCDNSLRMFALQ
jgi:hypothetical protein